MRKILFLLLLACTFAFSQQISVAVLPSDGDKIGNDELEALTDEMRVAALKVLPASAFVLLKQDVVVKRLGGAENYIKICTESSCIVDLGKKAQVDYVAQASVGKLGGKLRLKVELYNVRSEGLVGMLSDEAGNVRGLLDIVKKRVSEEVFGKIPGASSSSKVVSPTITGGISGVESTGGYNTNYEKSYLANITTEPAGAILSFNGVPIASCTQTPCKAELSGGSVRIVAVLEQYETTDTTISIRQNNQSINIKLKSNFGILDIKPAYSENIGSGKGWFLTINGQAQSSYENKLSPGNYEVKLSHECYEDINFKVGIKKGSREVFDMARYLNLKTGGLVLSAEKDGNPVSEPVFVNGKRVGETPFSGTVPICAEIGIGSGKNKVDVEIAYKQTVKYKHKIRDILGGVLTDSRDGKKYKTVKIGEQVWMAENLNYNASGSKCYNNQENNCTKYGRLYNWNTAMNVCPNGWHLPGDGEWDVLMKSANPDCASKISCANAGKLLKAKFGWNRNGNGTDAFGFSALPGGCDLSFGYFYDGGQVGFWWSSSERNSDDAYGRVMYYDFENVNYNFNGKYNLCSVRCLKGNMEKVYRTPKGNIVRVSPNGTFVASNGERGTVSPQSIVKFGWIETSAPNRATIEAPNAYYNQGDYSTYFNQGDTYYNQGDYDRAVANYSQAIKLNPNKAEAYFNRGKAYYKKGDYVGSIADFNQAVRLNPNYENAYYGTKGNEYKKGDNANSNDAKVYYNQDNVNKKNYNDNSKDANLYYDQGNNYYKKGDYDKAIADYSQVIKLDPNHANAYYNRGVAYDKKGNYDKAITDYSQVIKLVPNHANAYYNRGNVYYNKGNYDQAIADYSQVIRINPNDESARQNLEEAQRAKMAR